MEFIDLKRQRARLEPELSQRIEAVLAHQSFIQGPEVAELETALGAFSGASHVITCANGTDALQVALMALEIGPGDAVFVPSFTYTATAEAILLLGATPVFVEVDEASFNVDLAAAEAEIAAVVDEGRLRAAALITVDLFGAPVDGEAARALCDRRGLKHISDAAQSFGGRLDGRRVGTLADITTTSFFPAKPLGCYGDGGALFTEDAELAARMRSICQHGKGAAKYDVVRVGLNSRLDTLQAAILLPKLAIFGDEVERRHQVAQAYTERLLGYVRTPLPPAAPDDRSAWAQYTVQIEAGQLGGRDAVQARLKAAGVPSAVYYPRPMHRQPAYAHLARRPLPVSDGLCERVLSLPMHPYLTDAEIDQVCAALIGADTGALAPRSLETAA
ncbi:DegT/DnrJ/EryC1/StrS family aminotransferase [Caulobacter sp. KR2-114]|uniref:DegT/DnrJ/EryC1/StrS family aminotransferase n=1 Tax=Caulobacter sp. KR2-114 TaxID=3400912 RepID=UPI003BFE2348